MLRLSGPWCAPVSSALRRWLRFSWLDRFERLATWLADLRRRPAADRPAAVRAVRPALDVLESRWVPNDVLSVLTTGPILGSGLLSGGFTTPALAVLRGWGGAAPLPAAAPAAAAAPGATVGPARAAGARALEMAASPTPAASAPTAGAPRADQAPAPAAPHPAAGGGLQSPLARDWLQAVDDVFASDSPARPAGAFPGAARADGSGVAAASSAFEEPKLTTPDWNLARNTPAPAADLATLAGHARATPAASGSPTAATPAPAARTTGGGVTPSLAQAEALLGQSSVTFEPNVGQTAAQVSFLAKGPGYTFFLSGASAVLVLPLPGTAAGGAEEALRLEFVGGNPAAAAEGVGRLASITSYLTAPGAAGAHPAVPNYAGVLLRDVYPGIDVEFTGGANRAVEYTFIVHPGADPAAIQLRWSGVDGLAVDAANNLDLRTAGGTLVETPAVAYQGSSGGRQAVAVSRQLGDGNTVRFQVGHYDASRDLIIDPTLATASYLGGPGVDAVNAVTVDSSDNIYLTGTTGSSTYFPITAGVFQPTFAGGSDAFVTKMNPAGTAVVYSTYLYTTAIGGFHSAASGLAIAVDSSDNAYIAGGLDQRFVAKVNSTATSLLYLTAPTMGSSVTGSRFTAIAVDSSGNAYTTGTVLRMTLSGFPMQMHYSASLVIDKFDSTGSLVFEQDFVQTSTYPTQVQRPPAVGEAILLDGSGDLYVAGVVGPNLTTTSGVFQPSYGGSPQDAFVAELTTSGTLIWASYLGGASDDSGNAIARDSNGYLYVTGYTNSANFPTTSGAYQTALSTTSFDSIKGDAFVTKISSDGTSVVYSTYLGTGAGEMVGATWGYGIAVDSSGNAYIAGQTTCTDFPLQNPVKSTRTGHETSFISEFDSTGSSLLFSTYLSGTATPVGYVANDQANGIALNSSGDAIVVGQTQVSDFPVTLNAYQGTYGGPTGSGGQDGYVARITFP